MALALDTADKQPTLELTLLPIMFSPVEEKWERMGKVLLFCFSIFSLFGLLQLFV